MDRNDQASWLFVVLYCGSLWGLAEATAGHALHLLRIPGLAGFLMFPVGFFLMSRAFSRSGRFLAVFLTSWIAAGIKLADLVLPGSDVLAVWNPVQAILLEGLAAAGLILVLKKARATLAPALLASFTWRLAYAGLSLLWAALLTSRNLFQVGPEFLGRFLFLDSLANGLLIHFILRMRWLSPTKKASKLFRRPALAAALLIAALAVEVVL